MQSYIILAIIGTEKFIVTEVDGQTELHTDGWTEILTPISHPAISRCDKNIRNAQF